MRKEAYKHGFSGMCKPPGNPICTWNKTFSVGIFQWIPKASGKGLKKSAVKFRVKGNVRDAEYVYAEAEDLCMMFDDGWEPKHKSAVVKR
jgi:hypothetical protein